MINRSLIRIKVVQMLYSYSLTKEDMSLVQARAELKKSLDKTYELYHSLLWMMVDLTRLQEMKLDEAKFKYLPSDEDLNPNTRFVNNLFIKALSENKEMEEYMEENPISWHDELFMNMMLVRITSSKLYEDYMSQPSTDFKADTDFWRAVMKKIILVDDDFSEFLESKSVFWNDDLVSVSTFLLKTMNRWGEGKSQTLMPMFKDKEDEVFGDKLFLDSAKKQNEYNELIDKFIKVEKWATDRVPIMDRVILSVAISEILNYPKIPTSVSLNEYIDIAKYYSGGASNSFINGVLDNIIRSLKSEGKILKD